MSTLDSVSRIFIFQVLLRENKEIVYCHNVLTKRLTLRSKIISEKVLQCKKRL